MKTVLISLISILLFTQYSQAQADKIIGVWHNEGKDSRIEVYKKGNSYFGEIKWLANDVGPTGERPKRDANNPDPDKRDRPLVGKVILKDLKWDKSEKEWNDGEIYDPRSGNTYSLTATLENSNTLKLRGYLGFSVFGRTTTWTRAE